MVKNNLVTYSDLDTLIGMGYKELLNGKVIGINNTRVFVSKSGKIITINGKDFNGNYYGYFRDVEPVYKKAGQFEYRVYIDFRSHSVHKIVALTYPEICGVYSDGMQVHHKDLNHLNNSATNLTFLTPKVHKFVHKIINIFGKSIINDVNRYIDFCNLIGMEISEEGLGDYIYGR